MLDDELYMRECLALARKGAGRVSPNPMVGAVIVRKGRVIGRGYHRRFGGPHAELDAIGHAKGSLEGATIYVNLEPCNIFGKTPPCTDLIIRSGISRVVAGMADPNPAVNGSGIRQLRKAGLQVHAGVLEAECRELNESFVRFITRKLPFVTLKVAQTLDGRISDPRGNSKYITGPQSLKAVHRLRSQVDAIVVGAGTVNADDPLLTVRLVRGRNPARVILSGKLTVREDAHVFSGRAPGAVLLFCDERYARRQPDKLKRLQARGVEVVALRGRTQGVLPLHTVLQRLAARGMASVLVEGGTATYSRFLEQGAADKLLFFIAPKILGPGAGSFDDIPPRHLNKAIRLKALPPASIGSDILIEAYVEQTGVK